MAVGKGWDVPTNMQGWTDFHWWKVTGTRVLNLVMISEEPEWYLGHYVKGRMEPCYGDGCKTCREGVGQQQRFIFAAIEPISKKIGLLETSRTVGLEIRDLGGRRGGIHGMYFEITKHTRHKQSRMEITLYDDLDGFVYQAFETPDITKALCLTWEKAGFEIPDIYQAAPEVIPLKEPAVGRKKPDRAPAASPEPEEHGFSERAKRMQK